MDIIEHLIGNLLPRNRLTVLIVVEPIPLLRNVGLFDMINLIDNESKL